MTPDAALSYFGDWKKAYQLQFGDGKSPALADLSAFCHERETTIVKGDRDMSLVMEGRRQVILRIRNFLDLTPEQLVSLHTHTRPATGAISHEE